MTTIFYVLWNRSFIHLHYIEFLQVFQSLVSSSRGFKEGVDFVRVPRLLFEVMRVGPR
jgi:hypothetical protein